MKVAVIGTGAVGSSCTLSLILRGCARQIVLLDKDQRRAKSIAADMEHGVPLSRFVEVRAGDYEDLRNASVVIVTAGINEKSGGATDRRDPKGRLRLLDFNANTYREIVPKIVNVAPEAVILVVTDPPDPLAEIAREIAGHDRVVSSGTFLDSLRFRVHLAKEFAVDGSYVEAIVVGEHGTSQVFLWSSARICGVPVFKLLKDRGEDPQLFRTKLENEVKFANIGIIEGNGASQFGIGMAVSRIAEIILRDEQAVIPVGSYNKKYGVTLSLPSVVGCRGVNCVWEPEMSEHELCGLKASADFLRNARRRIASNSM